MPRVGTVDAGALLAVAVEAATAAGALLRERFGGPAAGVASKSSATDMVSDADRRSEALIRERIRAARPDDAILGEEEGAEEGRSGLRWVVDPLDGTTNYLFGIPQWCVSIACEDASGGLVGVVHDPLRGETFTAVRGAGAFLGDRRLAVSAKADLADALVATGFSYLPEERALAARVLERVLPRVRDVRRAGSAALDLAWTAAGRFDAYYEVPVHPWDRAAGVVLVREAGGLVSELPAIGPSGPGLVAAGPGLHDRLRALVLGGEVR
jgi:myo-inositol-1(or 4)-monophosphatase